MTSTRGDPVPSSPLDRVAKFIGLSLAFATVPAFAQSAATTAPSATQARELVQSLLVPSPYRISERARAGEIRYQLGFEPARSWSWPETGEQHVQALADKTVLTICKECGREPAPSDTMLKRYLTANPWVQSEDRQIAAFARQSAQGLSVDRRMKSLVTAIQAHMTGPIDYRGYDNAVTALRTRSGDCTEFAVLLAAVARAREIPTRVVYGIAYSSRFTGRNHVFSPHTWVQAWDGKRWVSYDAGLGQFDAGHIALFVGDGSTNGLPAITRAIKGLRIRDAAELSSSASRASPTLPSGHSPD